MLIRTVRVIFCEPGMRVVRGEDQTSYYICRGSIKTRHGCSKVSHWRQPANHRLQAKMFVLIFQINAQIIQGWSHSFFFFFLLVCYCSKKKRKSFQAAKTVSQDFSVNTYTHSPRQSYWQPKGRHSAGASCQSSTVTTAEAMQPGPSRPPHFSSFLCSQSLLSILYFKKINSLKLIWFQDQKLNWFQNF